jgi:hypothetical protein
VVDCCPDSRVSRGKHRTRRNFQSHAASRPASFATSWFTTSVMP